VNTSNTYTTARISDTRRGLEIISHLGGAYLTVATARQNAPITGDTNARLNHLNLSGIVQGKNTDVNGNIYVSVIDYGPTPPPDKAGRFEVALYSDAGRTNLVASGVTNSAGPLTLALNEMNRSGLSGTVDLDLATVVLDGPTSPLAAPPPGYAQFPRQENNIVIPLRGYEITGDDQGANPDGHQLSHLSLQGMVQGVNTDADGNLYAWVRQVGANYVVELYRSPTLAAADLVASGTISTSNGTVILVPQNTATISAQLRGTVRLAYNADDNTIILTPPKGLGLSGQKREQNVFATFNDTMDAMLANDAETLHDLLAAYKTDLDRILMGRADIGSRQDRLQMTRERHEDEKINFGRIRSEQIELDFAKAVTEFQAKQNVFEASLRVAAQIVPMSLVDFL
ncbi:MAG: flagellin, partial [Planctomycetota bacterium]|nr:flagellin [Planctomycetota bacterium]